MLIRISLAGHKGPLIALVNESLHIDSYAVPFFPSGSQHFLIANYI